MMLRLRKCNRRYLFYAILTVVLVTLTTHLISNALFPDVDNQVKIEIIERAIRSERNSQKCRIPELPVHSPEINKFLRHESPLECPGKQDDWVRCQQDRCTAQPRQLAAHFQLHCTFIEILRKTDFSIEEPGLATHVTFKSATDSYQLVHSDYARVKCKSSKTSERWKGIVIGVGTQVVLTERRRAKLATRTKDSPLPFNVLIFGFDSLSRNAFIRKLPKSYSYLVDTIGAHVLNGYNIVGDGTPQALIPILTGHTELELPETRRRMSQSVACDAYPMIWKDYEAAGYITAFNEDLPKVGTFTYRLNGFDEQPTDHYMRPYYLASESLQDEYHEFCNGDRPKHAVFMNYTYQILASQPKTPKFIFSFHGELSHDSINLIEVADEDLLQFLVELNENLLHDTILVVMSDHGNRFAEIRNTFQGKLEERLPFFSFAFPAQFKALHPRFYKNFVHNANAGRLVTPFDINRTLRHVLQLHRDTADPPFAHKPNRALSLFQPISADRSCAEAYIESHWCSCQHWNELKKYDNRAIKAALTVTEQINRLTQKFREICAPLQVETIKWAGEMEVNDDLIRFKGSSDRDGYLGSFADANKQVPLQMLQVKLVTRPGEGIYEASVRFNVTTNEYRVDTAQISRVNKYGDQARCIYDRDPELRKFCFCK